MGLLILSYQVRIKQEVIKLIDVLSELFIEEYFLINSFVNNRCDNKKLLKSLNEIYFLDSNEFKYIKELLSNENLNEIKTYDDYKRYKRIRQRDELLGLKVNIDDISMAISIKGKVLKNLLKYDIAEVDDLTDASIEKILIDNSNAGDIDSLKVLGFLKAEGLMVDKDLDNGLSKLLVSIKWGNLKGGLTYLKYDKNNYLVLKIIKSITEGTLYSKIPSLIEEKYNITINDKCDEVMLIKKAIAFNKLNENKYDSISSRLIYSNVISMKDKEKILFSEDKVILTDSLDLPLNLIKNEIDIDYSYINNIPFKREEQMIIAQAISHNIERFNNQYKPICLYSESPFLLNYYLKKLNNSFLNSNIEIFDVKDLRDFEINPTKNNILIRNLKENKNNIYIFLFEGEIDYDIINNLIVFLKTPKREKYIINAPSVTLDLSSILPICLSDKDNYDKLKDYVDGIELLPIKNGEKNIIINELISTNNIPNNDDLVEKLMNLSIEKISSSIDRLIKDDVDILDKEATLNYLNNCINKNKNKKPFGFGDISYEVK